MPLTFPSHAAAVLPLMGRRTRFLPPLALVVGTCAPDFAYLLGHNSPESHVPQAILTFSVPAGLLFYLWLELLILPALAQTVPAFLKMDFPALLRPRGLPATPAGWLAAIAAIAIGAGTHLLWDGFTHNWMWPAAVLYPEFKVELAGRVYPIARVFQYACHLIGAAIVVAYAYRRYPSEQAALFAPLQKLLPWALLVGLPALTAFLHRYVTMEPINSLEQTLWNLFWPTVGGGLFGATIYAAYLRVRGEAAPIRSQ